MSKHTGLNWLSAYLGVAMVLGGFVSLLYGIYLLNPVWSLALAWVLAGGGLMFNGIRFIRDM